MKTGRVLYHLARADFLERVRRYSFLLILAGTIFLGYAINRGDFYLQLDGYRGILNSAWVGSMMAATTILILSLFGFYLVKNAIERDSRTGVGQIIATTPISRPAYLLGKWLSNWVVLGALVGILAAAAILMQLFGGEARDLDIFKLLSPFLLLVSACHGGCGCHCRSVRNHSMAEGRLWERGLFLLMDLCPGGGV